LAEIPDKAVHGVVGHCTGGVKARAPLREASGTHYEKVRVQSGQRPLYLGRNLKVEGFPRSPAL
jgi:hypothetical protein